jgi:hypothetical protein
MSAGAAFAFCCSSSASLQNHNKKSRSPLKAKYLIRTWTNAHHFTVVEGDPCLNVVVSWIVLCIQIFKAKRPDRSDLRDVLTGSCPVEMKSIARQNDYAPGGYASSLSGSNRSPRPI